MIHTVIAQPTSFWSIEETFDAKLSDLLKPPPPGEIVLAEISGAVDPALQLGNNLCQPQTVRTGLTAA